MAAQRVVGQEGYAGATISRIAQAAGLSLGGFYYYFSSRQELFDGLLPAIGEAFFAFRDDRTRNAKCYIEFERQDFWALRQFIEDRPEFLRIFFEAPHYAPSAYERYVATGRARYLSRLHQAWDGGEMRNFRRGELTSIAEMILSSKIYLFRMYTQPGEPWLPEQMIETYLRFLERGLG